MESDKKVFLTAKTVLLFGSLWGIFEATIGLILHLLPFSIGWAVWYPAACFFMAAAYKFSDNKTGVLWVALLCALVKILDLFYSIRIDFVINPAVSIILEALAFYLGIIILQKVSKTARNNLYINAVFSLGINICWRALYSLYLMFFVPKWMRDLSIIASVQKLRSFWIKENLITSLIVFTCFCLFEKLKFDLFKPKFELLHKNKKLGMAIISILLFTDIILQLCL